MCRFRQLILAGVFGLIGCCIAQPAVAGFVIVSQSVSLNQALQTATFQVVFDHMPNFLAANSEGLALESFQYEVDGGWDGKNGPDEQDDLTAIIRGDEIRFSNKVRIRDPLGGDGPTAGGWGPLRTEVDYNLVGNMLEFTAPWSALGITSPILKYRLYTLAEGELQDWREAKFVPLPPAVVMGGLMLGGMWVMRRIRTRAS